MLGHFRASNGLKALRVSVSLFFTFSLIWYVFFLMQRVATGSRLTRFYYAIFDKILGRLSSIWSSFTFLFVCLFVCLFTCLSVCLSVSLFPCLLSCLLKKKSVLMSFTQRSHFAPDCLFFTQVHKRALAN